MPIRDEVPVFKNTPPPSKNGSGGGNPAVQLAARLNLDQDPVQGAACGGGGGPSNEDPEQEPEDEVDELIEEDGVPMDRQMQRLRKGFRLSSMCWD